MISGKEANVYHASTPNGIDRAVKIYKTSILVFKDRDKYVNGEFRFRHGYCKGWYCKYFITVKVFVLRI